MGFGERANLKPLPSFGQRTDIESRGQRESDRGGPSRGGPSRGGPFRGGASRGGPSYGRRASGSEFSEDPRGSIGRENNDYHRGRENNDYHRGKEYNDYHRTWSTSSQRDDRGHHQQGSQRGSYNVEDEGDDRTKSEGFRFEFGQRKMDTSEEKMGIEMTQRVKPFTCGNHDESVQRYPSKERSHGKESNDCRIRSSNKMEYGQRFGEHYSDEIAAVRERRGGFDDERSRIEGYTRWEKAGRERSTSWEDRMPSKENSRGFIHTIESRNFGRDGYECARNVGRGERGVQNVGGDNAVNRYDSFRRFEDKGCNPRRDCFYNDNDGFDVSRNYDGDKHGYRLADYGRERSQWCPIGRDRVKRLDSFQFSRVTSERFGSVSHKDESRGGQHFRNDQQHDDEWDSFGENTLRGRSSFGRNADSEKNTHFGGMSRTEMGGQKKRAPSNWVPEETPVEILFQRDSDSSKYFDKEQDDLVTVDGLQNYTPISSWENSRLHPQLVKTCIEKCNYKYVRPIQAATIPLVLDGFDVVGHAETGGGKTAAFVLPILHKILATCDRKSLRCGSILALVVAPTRELAKQLHDSFRKHAFETGVKCCVAYGEIPRWHNLEQIRKGCQVLIGTSGRLMDFIEKCEVDLSMMRFLILDEADMLLEQGQHHLLSILRHPNFPKSDTRQTLLFSATFPKDVEQLARNIMKTNYVKISNGAHNRANARVVQLFEKVGDIGSKNDKLFDILEKQREDEAKDDSVMRTLVFVDTKKRADFVANMLLLKGIKAGSINSDRPQDERERLVNQLREGILHVLVGTDVCQRGLDIHGLDHVINYELPNGPPNEALNKYVHRIGRTGRTHGGRATTFIDCTGVGYSTIELIVKAAKESAQEIPPWLEEMVGQKSCGDIDYSIPSFGSAEATSARRVSDKGSGELGSANFTGDKSHETDNRNRLENDGEW